MISIKFKKFPPGVNQSKCTNWLDSWRSKPTRDSLTTRPRALISWTFAHVLFLGFYKVIWWKCSAKISGRECKIHCKKFREFSLRFLREYSIFLVGKMIFPNILGNFPKMSGNVLKILGKLNNTYNFLGNFPKSFWNLSEKLRNIP